MDIRPVTLEGRFVRLEPMRFEHYEAFVELTLGTDIFRWFPIAMQSREDLLAYVRRFVGGVESGTTVPFTTIERSSGRIVGSTSFLNIDREHRHLEVGATWLGVPWQRSVCNTEAKYLQLRHCFEELGCVRVEFKTDSCNQRSRAALTRLGAVEEGTLRNHMICADGRLRHSVYFSVIAAEWPAMKQRLEGMLAR